MRLLASPNTLHEHNKINISNIAHRASLKASEDSGEWYLLWSRLHVLIHFRLFAGDKSLTTPSSLSPNCHGWPTSISWHIESRVMESMGNTTHSHGSGININSCLAAICHYYLSYILFCATLKKVYCILSISLYQCGALQFTKWNIWVQFILDCIWKIKIKLSI